MVYSFLKEAVAIILCFIKTDYLSYVEVLEDVDIAGSGVAIAMHGVPHVNWSHEGDELARDDPVEVAVLDLLVMLVLPCIKCLEVIPS